MIPKFQMCDSCKERKELRRRKISVGHVRRWAAKNVERLQIYRAAWYQKNKERIRKQQRAYRRANPEKRRAIEQKSYLKRKAARAAVGDAR